LGRTFAVAVEAAERVGVGLVIGECLGNDHGEAEREGNEADLAQERMERRDPWREQVPLLNGSVRVGGEERVWAGRTVEIRKVVGRWCRFVTVDGNELQSV